ncbi:Ankyrin repeat-containing protein [Artemisia annua]|uniref:Ankyrin repeat-containing protein n=1 Tax=Artemisia annua TaxID=35608 RepID=A0A2U1Q6L4_ARTAN|nr:Ankyrin repeat-containing protein [Artemisia annua]
MEEVGYISSDVWKMLKNTYGTQAAPRATTTTVTNTSNINWKEYRPLYGAIVNGHWEKAREYFINDKSALIAKVNDDHDSPLHLGIAELHRAALVGNTKAAKMLVEKNPYLLFIPDKQNFLPIHRAIFGSHDETFFYLLEVTKRHIELSRQGGYHSPFEGINSSILLTNIIGSGYFVCIKLGYVIFKLIWLVSVYQTAVPHIKQLQKDKVKNNKALLVLKCICKELSQIDRDSDIREHYHEAVTLALEHDNSEAIEEITSSFPQAIWTKHNDFHIAQFSVINRCQNVFNFLVHEVVTDRHVHKVLVDKDGNTLLHLVGKLAPIHKLNLVSGTVKQKNKNQQTPFMEFRKEHQELRKEGEEWMKKTVDSYRITAALIITIVFAAAITVPGGNDGDTGKPIYDTRPNFIIFVVADALSLFTSTTSLLLFLSILTTRYRDEDFLYRLPKRLILGLDMLFLSLPLLFDLISSTYGKGIFGKQSDHASDEMT